MSELDDLQRERASLRRQVDGLLRRATSADDATTAFAPGDVETGDPGAPGSPAPSDEDQQKLRLKERLLSAIFDSALEGMLLAGDDGRYFDANPAACELFGLPHAELVGRRIVDFVAPGHDREVAHRAFHEQGRNRGRFPLQRLDGSRRTLDYSAVPNVLPGLHLSVFRDITDQVASEDGLRQSEARLRAVIEQGNQAVSLTGRDGNTRYLTPLSAARLLGLAPDELEARTPRDQVVPADRPQLERDVERLAGSGDRESSMEFRIRRGDGEIRWIEATSTNLLDDPDVAAIVGNYRDITARKNAEEALVDSRDLLQEAEAIAHVGSWSSGIGVDKDLRWSRECYRIFGIPEGTPVTAETRATRVHSADRDAVRNVVGEAVGYDLPYDVEHRIELPDGRVRWVRERAVVERSTGRPTRLNGSVQDVTESHLAIEALRASEDRYRRIVENTSEGVWVYDAHGVTTFMSARMAEMLGYTIEEAVRRPAFSLMDVRSRAAAEAGIERRKGRSAERADSLLMRKDGTNIWVSIQANPLFDADDHLEAVLSLVTDVSAQRVTEQARARLAAIVESSEDAILSETLDGTITSWNLGAEKLYQYSAAEMVGRSVEVLTPSWMADDERMALDVVARGEALHHHETKRLRKDGSVVEVTLTVSPIRDAEGVVVGAANIARDLTARRDAEAALERVEEQFRQAQKMEAVGRLAGGVAHDFNNLLSVILSYTELAVESLAPGDLLRDDLQEIRTAAERATDLTRQLLAFSRQQVLQPRVIDLNDTVSDMERMLGRLLGEDVELTFRKGRALGCILADRGQVEQIVMNLAVNARDAMPDGGKLTIETANVFLDAAIIGGRLGVVPGPFVMLGVSDTGTGMDAATRERIFEPFFTTKEQGKGTGLGLATVFGIAQQSGGYVAVYSEAGSGSTFKVYLPETDRAPTASIRPAPAALERGSETVLLVEDEEQVRAVGCMILRGHGYHVLTASNGAEGLIVSRGFEGRIHLLLTDVVMPVMSGRKLAEQLVTERSEIKVLFVSGYTDDAVVRHGVLESGVAFLQKPFTPAALLRSVRDSLETAPQPRVI